MIIELVLFSVALASFLVYWIKDTYSFFEKINVQHDKPIPVLGSFKKVIFKQVNMFDYTIQMYSQFTSK